jgi:hypothetical protein
MTLLHVKVEKTFGGRNRGKIVEGGLDCATARQMSASLIKLDFSPVLRESNIQTYIGYTKNSGISKTTFILPRKVPSYCIILEFFPHFLPPFLQNKDG